MIASHISQNRLAVVAAFVDRLTQRRVAGEVTSLYSELRDTSDIIAGLRDGAPMHLQTDLAILEGRCSKLLFSIAH